MKPKRTLTRKCLLVLPNVLSCLRLFIGLLIIFFSEKIMHTNVVILFTFGCLTDFFDGFLARRYNCVSKLGSILDPLSDKLFMNAMMWFLYKNNYLSLHLFLLFLFRDMMIIVGFMMLTIIAEKTSTKTDISVRFIGKVSTTLHMLMCIYTLFFQEISTILMYLLRIIIIASLFVYTLDFFKEYSRLKKIQNVTK